MCRSPRTYSSTTSVFDLYNWPAQSCFQRFVTLCSWRFEGKHKLRNAKALNIACNDTEIKQYAKVKCLWSILDQSVSGESKASNVIDKVNSRLKFLHRTNRFLTPSLLILLCNALIRPFFWLCLHILAFKSLKLIKIISSSITEQVHQVLLTVT